MGRLGEKKRFGSGISSLGSPADKGQFWLLSRTGLLEKSGLSLIAGEA